jgi:beta-lactamase superfamily II metal-dependent hydrolase
MVVTHIDADHIDGSVILLRDLPKSKIHLKELWFNGWSQLPKAEDAPPSFAPLQGEFWVD